MSGEFDVDPEQWRRQFWGDNTGSKGDTGPKRKTDTKPKGNGADSAGWGEPDMGVLRLRRRPPPALPLEVFGETWKQWLLDAADAAACPADYVVAPLLTSVSTLIGNARWGQAWPGWNEPPPLWTVVVGDSGTGKSPGADCLMRDVLPTIERRMVGDYPDRLHEWQAAVEFDRIAKKRWKDEFREAQEKKKPLPPIPKPTAPDIAPEKPRLDLGTGNPPSPILMSLTPDAQRLMDEFGAEMEARLDQAGGLLRSAFGKARGAALRLSLVLEWLWCCARADMSLPPDSISKEAFAAAATLVGEYFMPMAERVFGDAGATDVERDAATLTRWILKGRPDEVHVRTMIREVRLPGLRSAEQIKKAADLLVEADWLRAPAKTVFGQPRSRVAYPVNPRLWGP